MSTTHARPSPSPAERLLDWYDRHGRVLPWRARPGERPDPYRVWLSEVMLQQTNARAVAPRFERFLERWPSLEALAAAERAAVLDEWAGLGYYARARNLHKCAQVVTAEYGGQFPQDAEALQRLPGIGPYTAAAIAAIAFDEPVAAVDGNVERVVARYFAVDTPLPQAKPELREAAQTLVPDARAGDFTQALMDLGATICRPARPNCLLCPLRGDCAAHAAGMEEVYPQKAAKRAKPTRRAIAFWVSDGESVLLRRRAESGLLGGMLELPSSPWQPREAFDLEAAFAHAPVAAEWDLLSGEVRHTFTHFHLELRLAAARDPAGAETAEAFWMPLTELDRLPTVMRKAARFALNRTGREAAGG